MKLNNKGFAISSVMYLILVIALIIVAITISLITNRKMIIDKQKRQVLNSFESDLILSKITYISIPFDNTWTLNNASIDANGYLTLGANGAAASAYSTLIEVNGGIFNFVLDAYTEKIASSFSSYNMGGVNWTTSYYDASQNSTTNNEGYGVNGWAVILALNRWVNNVDWYTGKSISKTRWGPNVKYVSLTFTSGPSNSWSNSPTKVRNLKLYGTKVKNSFYIIEVKLNSSNSISQIKYAKGLKPLSYFGSNGIVSTDASIRVTENGTYTVYVKDNTGKESIASIEITDIQ